VPDETTMTYDAAVADLQSRGFKVARQDVDSKDPAGTVVGQNPVGGTQASKGSTITLKVSKGPSTQPVPDVGTLSQGDAKATLQQGGFKVKIVQQDTIDPAEDGIVLAQDPAPDTQAKPGDTVTITVGHFVVDTTTVTTTDTTGGLGQ
jgi:serine/threonine-protein kinase